VGRSIEGMTRALLSLAATAVLALTACGTGDPADTGAVRQNGPDAKTRKAMLAFAKCMREHGVDAPDPKFSADGVRQEIRGKGSTPEQQRAAQEACKKYQAQIKGPALSAEEKKEFRKQALANAQCMREHGIDMPDPQFDEEGRVTMRIGENGKRPDEEKLRKAAKACESTMPGIKDEK
jgi:hypothetical protein